MHDFDKSTEHVENRFAKHNTSILENFFGTTDVTSFWIADMEFEIAKPIIAELQRIVDRAVYSYEFAPTDLRQAISDWFLRRHDLLLNPERFLQVPSVLTGISLLIRTLSKPQDGVLIQTPVYHQFANIIKSANRKIVANPLINNEGKYTMDFADLEQKFKYGDVKLMLLCNPHNPVGRVWKKEELSRVLELANQYNITVISDEIHADIIYSPHTFCSFMSLDADKHIALIGSTAKTFGMHSISNGFMYIPEKTKYEIVKSDVSGMFLDHGSAFTTFATIAAYKHGEPWVEELSAYHEKVLAWMTDFIATELPKIIITPVEGTYQIWLDFSEFGLTTEELKNKIIKEAKLGLAHGDWFDPSGAHDQFMRLNFASPLAKIQAAFISLKRAFS